MINMTLNLLIFKIYVYYGSRGQKWLQCESDIKLIYLVVVKNWKNLFYSKKLFLRVFAYLFYLKALEFYYTQFRNQLKVFIISYANSTIIIKLKNIYKVLISNFFIHSTNLQLDTIYKWKLYTRVNGKLTKSFKKKMAKNNTTSRWEKGCQR